MPVKTPVVAPSAPAPAATPAAAEAPVPDPTPARAAARPAPRGVAGGSRSGDTYRGIARGPYGGRRVRIPTAVHAGSDVVPAGTYEVKLESSAEGPSVLLVRDGRTVGRELAVRPVRQPSRAGTGSWVWVDRRDEPMVRVFTQSGHELFFAVFPEASGHPR